MSHPYSKLLAQDRTQSAVTVVTLFTVPSSKVWVVRDATIQCEAVGDWVHLGDADDSIVWLAFTQAAAHESGHWSGMQVFEPGAVCWYYASAVNTRMRLSGYELDA